MCAIQAMVLDELTTEFVLELNFMTKFKVKIKIEQQCPVMHHQGQ